MGLRTEARNTTHSNTGHTWRRNQWKTSQTAKSLDSPVLDFGRGDRGWSGGGSASWTSIGKGPLSPCYLIHFRDNLRRRQRAQRFTKSCRPRGFSWELEASRIPVDLGLFPVPCRVWITPTPSDLLPPVKLRGGQKAMWGRRKHILPEKSWESPPWSGMTPVLLYCYACISDFEKSCGGWVLLMAYEINQK